MRHPFTSTGNTKLNCHGNLFAIMNFCEACNDKQFAIWRLFLISETLLAF
jgi:hypothetical protein